MYVVICSLLFINKNYVYMNFLTNNMNKVILILYDVTLCSKCENTYITDNLFEVFIA